MPSTPPDCGQVLLIGAGPGDAGLITMRGLEYLRRADVVVYDYLVNPRILRHARPTAELVCIGRHGQGRILSQAEVNQRLIDEARAGKIVARLKGGDPGVFARAAEETTALEAAGIPFEVVPGVTAALAVASYAGIPLTHRDWASAVALVTGHECEDKADSALDFARLAAFPGTLVFYMGLTTAPQWSSELMAGGKPPETPAAIVRRCSWPDQRVVTTTLGQVAAEIEQRKMRPPVIVVLGDVVRQTPASTWFSRQPLFGQNVLVTRPVHQADGLSEQFEALGAAVWEQPAIEILPPESWEAVDQAIENLASYQWLVFSSINGVQAFLDRLLHTGRDLRALAAVRLAAVGSATAAALERYHLRADFVPAEFRAEKLAEGLTQAAAGQRFLLLRASRGREILAETLRAAGATVDQVVVYRSVDACEPRPEIKQLLERGEIDWVTITSSAIARSLHAMFGSALARTKLASISPVTSETLRGLGLSPAAEATVYTMPGLVAAIRRHTNA